MVIKKTASAGAAEKNDALVTVSPSDGNDIEVVLESIVAHQFGGQMIQAAKDMAAEMGVTGVRIRIEDKGALDYVIRARTEAAILRAAKGEEL